MLRFEVISYNSKQNNSLNEIIFKASKMTSSDFKM
jgi:hypothetical protein